MYEAECGVFEGFNKNTLTENTDELAKRLGVTPQASSKWEKGLSSPDISMVCNICGVLDVSADYLLGTGNGKIKEEVEQVEEATYDYILGKCSIRH